MLHAEKKNLIFNQFFAMHNFDETSGKIVVGKTKIEKNCTVPFTKFI